MNTQPTDGGPTRRHVLQRGAFLSITLGLGLPAMAGSTAARDHDFEAAIHEESGLSKADSKKALEGFVRGMTDTLIADDGVCVERFGCLYVCKEPNRGRYQDGDDLTLRKRPGRRVPQTGPPENDPGSRGRYQDGDDLTLRKRPGRRVPETGPTENDVGFRCSPEFAAALGILPGESAGRNAGGPAYPVLGPEQLTRTAEISPEDAASFLDAFIAVTSRALKKGDEVSLVGFGSFSISKRSARTGHNPQTGKEIKIAAKNVVKFKAGAELSGQVN